MLTWLRNTQQMTIPTGTIMMIGEDDDAEATWCTMNGMPIGVIFQQRAYECRSRRTSDCT